MKRRLINGVDPFEKIYQTVSRIAEKKRKEEEGSRFFLDKFGRVWASLNASERSLVTASARCKGCSSLSWFEISTSDQRLIGESISRMRSFVVNSAIVSDGCVGSSK